MWRPMGDEINMKKRPKPVMTSPLRPRIIAIGATSERTESNDDVEAANWLRSIVN